jgi:copper transport protein
VRSSARWIVAAVVLGGVLLLPRGVAAHALLVASDPKAGATVETAPGQVTLTFGEAPDPKLSTIRVLDTGGHDQSGGPVETVPGQPDQLRVQLRPLPDGVYTVAWRTVSTVDGHVAAGSFAFGVGVPPPTSGPAAGTAPTSQSASPAATIVRWLLYVGLIGMVGAAFLGVAVHPDPPRSIRRMAGVGWVAATAGSIGVVGVQWADIGIDFGSVLGSSIGLAAAERLAAIVLTGIAVALLVTRRANGRGPYAGVLLAATVAIFVDVLNGHAANGPWWVLQVAVELTHVVAVGIWVGGLAALLIAVRGRPSAEKWRAVRTFSTWAGLGIGVVAVTGLLRAVAEVQTLHALFTSDFGAVVILKSAGLAALAILGAANRYLNVPAAGRTLRGLRLVGTTELAMGAIILVATGLLVNLAPPSAGGGQASPSAQPIVAVGSDFGTSVRVRLLVDPGAAGFNTFTATATDYDSGAPAAVTGASLRFQLASRSGVGSSRLDLAQTSGGRFSGTGGNLSLDGIWNVIATLAGTGGSVEVPLVVATRVDPQPVDLSSAPGTPTISIVHLPNGGTAQVYDDPGVAGKSELHVTFFDAAGTESPIPSATISLIDAAGTASIMTPRILEPGHFVADVTLAAGTLTIDVIGQLPGADPTHVHLDMQIQP